MAFDRIAILGAGAWGTALANAISRAGREVTLWARDPASAGDIAARRESPRLPGIRLEQRIRVAADLASCARADVVMLAVPAQVLREVASGLARAVRSPMPIVVCAKGIEQHSGLFMTEVLAQVMPAATPAVLSGPSFAADVARGMPTAVTLAAEDEDLASALAVALGSPAFRPYHATDMRGVEIGGAAKNVLAIAAGIAAGRGLGASAVAALTTRGFSELFRFGQALGARPETLTGLSGLGDLILTCSTSQSRNFSLGIALGERGIAAGSGAGAKLAEGAFTAAALADMAERHGIDMPIAQAVAAVLDRRLTVDAAIESLLTRPLRAEA